MNPRLTLLSLLFSCSLGTLAQSRATLYSPDKNLVFQFEIKNGQPGYSIRYKQKSLVSYSSLALHFDDGAFDKAVIAGKISSTKERCTYQLVVGKTTRVDEPVNRLSIPLKQSNAPFHEIQLDVAAFNDGIAFRYHFPDRRQRQQIILRSEDDQFNLSGNPSVHTLFLPDYTTSHEGLYTTAAYQSLRKNELMDMPTLFEFPDHIFMSITEAALLDYAGMYLVKTDLGLISRLSPSPDDSSIAVKADLPHNSPWRVFLISDRIGTIVETNILTSLAPPLRIKDVSWIKPGKTTFPWWNGNVTPDTLNAPGNNFVTQQYYIDFCARNHIEYHSVVEYGLHQWYMDDGISFMPGPHADVTTPVPGLDMKEVCDYAHSKGVGIRVWVHWKALYPKLDSAFTLFEQWGISGMMVDFLDRDDQQMVNIQTEILEKAAQHHLHIQFHGAYKPTGLNRTYPNEFTREGAMNYEHDKWNPEGVTPAHDLDIAFTRALAGATDYHLGGFRAVPRSGFRAQYPRPLVLGTRCHMLGMYVILENANSMVCDYPAAYEGQPGFDFIREVPTHWDSTKVIAADPFHFLVTARRQGSDWYAGGICDSAVNQLTLPLDFLGDGSYMADIYLDAAGDSDPNHLQLMHQTVTRRDQLPVHMSSGGGIAIRFKKQ